MPVESKAGNRLAGSSGSGAVIRRAVIRDYFNAAGSRRKIGLLAKASFFGWNRVERYEP